MSRLRLVAAVSATIAASLAATVTSAEAQSEGAGYAGREGSRLLIRNDASGQKQFYVFDGAFWPKNLFVGNREVVGSDGVSRSAPATGPGCEAARGSDPRLGDIRCPLDGVTDVVVDMGSGGLTLEVNGTAPPIAVSTTGLDARRGQAGAPPALAGLAVRLTGPQGGSAAAGFAPAELKRFEVTGSAGPDEVRASGGTDVRVDTGAGDDTVFVYGAAGTVTIATGTDSDNVRVATRAGAKSSIDGGPGDDEIESADLVPTDITCGSGADFIRIGTADSAGAGCAEPIAGLERRTGSLVCPDNPLQFTCALTPGTGKISGKLNKPGPVVTIRQAGRLKRPAVVTAAVLSGAFPNGKVLAESTARHPAGPLTLRLRATPAGRRGALSPTRTTLRLRLRTSNSSSDSSRPPNDDTGIPFKIQR